MKKKSTPSGKNISELESELKKALKAPRKDVKIRVNTFIDLDIYDALNAEAEISGEKYQTLLNKYLRAVVFKKVSESDIKAIKIALGA
jgi:uncharacterized protein (DUF4415 family)